MLTEITKEEFMKKNSDEKKIISANISNQRTLSARFTVRRCQLRIHTFSTLFSHFSDTFLTLFLHVSYTFHTLFTHFFAHFFDTFHTLFTHVSNAFLTLFTHFSHTFHTLFRHFSHPFLRVLSRSKFKPNVKYPHFQLLA